jgi:hypothetical protein
MLVPLMKATFMPRITRRPGRMTTRKQRGPGGLALVALAAALLAGAGCATRGPLHVYALTTGGEQPVLDTGNGQTSEVPSFLEEDEIVTGFAYDPFTDHFFLRLDPGDRIRVVDRPARAIKREYEIEGRPRGRGDLAVRPRDGHLFLLDERPGQVLEITRLGKAVGEFALADTGGRPAALAFDSTHDHLLVLDADGQRVTVHDARGKLLRSLRLDTPAGASLAFDPIQREFFAPRRDQPEEILVFDETGRRQRTVRTPKSTGLIDVGERSFVRVF